MERSKEEMTSLLQFFTDHFCVPSMKSVIFIVCFFYFFISGDRYRQPKHR